MIVHANGINMRCQLDGAGPLVTLAHALGCDLSIWQALTQALQSSFTVLSYDIRGHGGSAAPDGEYDFAQLVDDVVALQEALGFARSHFVGLSLGGMIGQHFAIAQPQRLQRLALVSTACRTPPHAEPMWRQRIAAARAEGMGAHVEGALQRWFTPAWRAAHADTAAYIGGLVAATPVAGYCGCAAAIQGLDVCARLADIEAPTLVLAGAEDAGMPPANGAAIAAAIPGARFESVANASHLLCIEQQTLFNSRMLQFLSAA